MTSSNFATITLLLTLLIAGCANNSETSSSAQSTTSVSSEMTAAIEESPDYMICTYEKIVGKLIREKYCYTRKKRDQLREEAQEGNKIMKSGRLSNTD